MGLFYISTIFAVSLTYFYFNWFFFKHTSQVLGEKPLSHKWILFAFIVNYSFFVICGYLTWHLVVNWTVFFFFFLAEIYFFYHRPLLQSCILALEGIIVGLAVNIFFRNALAIVLDVPLTMMDNNVAATGNIKQYPVALGFIVSGIIFWYLCKRQKKEMSLILWDRKNLRFLLALMIAMHLYLFINLILYYTDGNYNILKIWGIKSSVFVIVGLYLILSYSYRISLLNKMRIESRIEEQKLFEEREKERELQLLSTIDPLTGCMNRKFLQDMMPYYFMESRVFCLSFADLNGLKTVNDSLGHQMGNQYLMEVVEVMKQVCKEGKDVLCRYGGDEFIILFFDENMEYAVKQMNYINQALERKSNTKECPFQMSVSFGIVESASYVGMEEMIKDADEKMYEQKVKIHQNRRE